MKTINKKSVNHCSNEEYNDHCLICESDQLEEIVEFAALSRITSDCRPFPSGGRLAVCKGCGAVQKYPDKNWLSDIDLIYSQYSAYFQADGDEQIILDSRTGAIRRRSDVILERMTESIDLPANGKALDIGCGSGVTLSALNKVLPGWELYGQDLDKRNEQRLETNPGFVELFECTPENIPGQYDLITLIHSLEHFPSPSGLLKTILTKLSPGGILLVEVCNTMQNPYDLLIADHLTHFSDSSLKLIAENSGFVVDVVETDWVSKELSMIAINSEHSLKVKKNILSDSENIVAFVHDQISWLLAMKHAAELASNTSDRFGIFGTSICATWLAGVLGDRVSFFVDEDPSRQGKEYMGKRIEAPQQIDANSKVYMALIPEIADKISARIGDLPMELVLPPSYTSLGNSPS